MCTEIWELRLNGAWMHKVLNLDDRNSAGIIVGARWWRLQLRVIIFAVLAGLFLSLPATAREITAEQLDHIFPGATLAGPFEGTPPAAAIRMGGAHVGYVLSTLEVVDSTGYAGAPMDVLVGLDLEGNIVGAELVLHSEPILVIGIPGERLERFVSGFAGMNIRAEMTSSKGATDGPDFVAGASVSSAVIQDSIIRASRTVAFSRGILGGDSEGQVERGGYEIANWSDLVADGSLVQYRLSRGQVEDLLSRPGALAATTLTERERADTFIHLYTGLLTPPRIGQNLLGPKTYNRLAARLGLGDYAIIIAGHGLYSFKGAEYRQSGIFERFQLVQGARTIRFAREDYTNLENFWEGLGEAAELREIGVFVIKEAAGFDPLMPWRLELTIPNPQADALLPESKVPVVYDLPARYRTIAAPIEPEAGGGIFQLPGGANPLWLRNWESNVGKIIGLLAMLVGLGIILMFQDVIVSRTVLYKRIRIGFLLTTLVWLGFYAGGQLSVINALTFLRGVMTNFRWEHFLVDPMAFILWSYVAVTMLFWGRGVFCGWLCPFGALQELLNMVAQKLRVPQLRIPFLVHERLWPIKYILFLGLFAVSLNSMVLAINGAEVEPFKTVITMRFMRHWPFLLYAGLLLGAGIFMERFFCRYLCPLGAALAIPARLRMFDWLQRRWQCGRECSICDKNCPVQAIHPNGSINPNECIHCLKCQSFFYDDHSCPPLIAKRKRREARREANTRRESGANEGAANVE